MISVSWILQSETLSKKEREKEGGREGQKMETEGAAAST